MGFSHNAMIAGVAALAVAGCTITTTNEKGETVIPIPTLLDASDEEAFLVLKGPFTYAGEYALVPSSINFSADFEEKLAEFILNTNSTYDIRSAAASAIDFPSTGDFIYTGTAILGDGDIPDGVTGDALLTAYPVLLSDATLHLRADTLALDGALTAFINADGDTVPGSIAFDETTVSIGAFVVASDTLSGEFDGSAISGGNYFVTFSGEEGEVADGGFTFLRDGIYWKGNLQLPERAPDP